MNRSCFLTLFAGLLALLTATPDAAAYLHPGLGRFVQREPLGYVDGMNLQLYQRQNPTGWLDPTGNSVEPAGVDPGPKTRFVSTLTEARAARTGYIYTDIVALDKAIDEKLLPAALGVAASRYSWALTGENPVWNSLFRKMKVSPNIAPKETVHEAIHMYNTQMGKHQHFWQSRTDEGLGYASYVIYDSLLNLRKIEAEMANDNPNYANIETEWKIAWSVLWNNFNAQRVSWTWGGDEWWMPWPSDPISTLDIYRLKSEIGIGTRCEKIALKYNEIAKKKPGCRQFVCERVSYAWQIGINGHVDGAFRY